MTRKHFQAIADALRASRPDTDDASARAQWAADVDGLMHVCMANNPRFDQIKFLRACGFARRVG